MSKAMGKANKLLEIGKELQPKEKPVCSIIPEPKGNGGKVYKRSNGKKPYSILATIL